MDPFKELDHVFDSHFGEAPPLPDAPASDPADGDDDVEAAGQPSVDHLARQFCDNGSGTAENECTSNDNHIVEDTNTCEQICRTECGCTKNCMSQFTQDEIEQNILLLRELEKTEKEMLLMGVLKQCGIDKKHVTERKRVRYSYVYRNQRVCRQAFQLLYDTKERTLDNIQKHMQSHGATPRVHANTGRRPHNAFKFDEIKDAVQFVVNYAEQYGLPQPAASRGQDTAPPVFLPCSDTKHSIHMVYRSGCEERGARPLGLSSFKDVWSQCVPHIKISSPRQDVCHVCELLRRRIQDAVGDTQKLKATTEFQDHLMKAQVEKEAYQLSVRRSLEELADVDKETRPVPAMSTAFTKIHYTFDFSQQLQIPHHARQMGPIYFTVPRKVQLFGVRLDGIPHQYNYLVDEAQTIGVNGSKTHGPDAVISMLHHAFTSYSFGENECLIHADNCGGQNKNRYVIAYFAWRVMTGKHQQITYMMQVPGHARCLVDSNFAHIKRRYKRSDVDSLLQLRDVVDKSACSNTAVMYGQEDSWHWCDWKGFLGDVFLPMKGIRSCQVFRFHADHPGVVFTKSSAAGEEKRVLILRKGCTVDTSALPTELAPGGIDDERRHYLFTHIRKFVRDPWKDLTCPPANAEE